MSLVKRVARGSRPASIVEREGRVAGMVGEDPRRKHVGACCRIGVLDGSGVGGHGSWREASSRKWSQ